MLSRVRRQAVPAAGNFISSKDPRRVADLEQYRQSELEQLRTSDLLSLLPNGRTSVLDIGARDGHFARLLTQYFPSVTALDLQRPAFNYKGVETLAGDATRLDFADRSFDCVFCAEVLEHIPEVEKACSEILRVARHEVIIGVPYKQDIRLSRTTCLRCGRGNPPWGHVNRFDERRLDRLFAGAPVTARSFVGTTGDSTNDFATWLMDLGGNPWGTYDQEEPCLHCGGKLAPPPAQRPLTARICSALALRLNRVQRLLTHRHAIWIHTVFSKIQ